MQARLKQLHSPDVRNLESWVPENPASWSFLLQAMIGPEDGEGEESFDIRVCTPSWFATNLLIGEIRSGQHTLFMHRYDYGSLKAYLEARIRAAAANTWSDIAAKLAGLGHWEFADYRRE